MDVKWKFGIVDEVGVQQKGVCAGVCLLGSES